MSEEEQYQATKQLAFAERGLVPKRLHRVTARLRHDVGEARRLRLPPPGRDGAWHQCGKAGEAGKDGGGGEEGGGPDDVSSWHGVKVKKQRAHVSSHNCSIQLRPHGVL